MMNNLDHRFAVPDYRRATGCRPYGVSLLLNSCILSRQSGRLCLNMTFIHSKRCLLYTLQCWVSSNFLKFTANCGKLYTKPQFALKYCMKEIILVRRNSLRPYVFSRKCAENTSEKSNKLCKKSGVYRNCNIL